MGKAYPPGCPDVGAKERPICSMFTKIRSALGRLFTKTYSVRFVTESLVEPKGFAKFTLQVRAVDQLEAIELASGMFEAYNQAKGGIHTLVHEMEVVNADHPYGTDGL